MCQFSWSVGLAQADWVELTGSASGRFTVYADPVTQHIAKKGGMVRMSVLFDYKAVQKLNSFSYLSMRAQQQFDCKEELSRRLASSLFAGNMANGKVVSTDLTEGPWVPFAPGSIGHTLWNVACDTAKH